MEDETVLDTSVETETEVVEPEAEIEAEETPDQLKERLAKAEEVANNYKTRAEKAEKKAKELKTEVSQSKDLSTSDLYALMKADVAQEDIEEVAEYAKLKKISVQQALGTGVVKAILAEKQEERKTAAAAHTGTARRTTGQTTAESLVENASKGQLPDSDADLERMIKARKGLK